MAILRFRVGHVHATGALHAAQSVRYLVREGSYAPDVAAGKWTDLVHQETANLPAWAHGSAEEFFVQAEQHERVNGRVATTWQMALPRELDREAQITMAREFLEAHLTGKAYLWVVHAPVNAQGVSQPHLHVLFSERTHDAYEREIPQHYFRQWWKARPERGGCRKDPWFTQRNHVWQMRTAWSDWTNYTFERAGVSARVHPGSRYVRGLATGKTNDPQQEQAIAVGDWERRKVHIGVTDSVTLPQKTFVHQTVMRARQWEPGQWIPGTPTAEEYRQAKQVRFQKGVQKTVRQLETHLRLLTRRQKTIARPRGRSRGQESVGHGLRAHLREERTYERSF